MKKIKCKCASEYEECERNHLLNERTIKAIDDSKKEENLVKVKNVRDLFNKLGW